MKAIWRGLVVAESDDIVQIGDDYFFPLASVKPQYLKLSRSQAASHHAGHACFFSLKHGRHLSPDAVCYFDDTKYVPREAFGRFASEPLPSVLGQNVSLSAYGPKQGLRRTERLADAKHVHVHGPFFDDHVRSPNAVE